jgi:hypothetical protein
VPSDWTTANGDGQWSLEDDPEARSPVLVLGGVRLAVTAAQAAQITGQAAPEGSLSATPTTVELLHAAGSRIAARALKRSPRSGPEFTLAVRHVEGAIMRFNLAMAYERGIQKFYDFEKEDDDGGR